VLTGSADRQYPVEELSCATGKLRRTHASVAAAAAAHKV